MRHLRYAWLLTLALALPLAAWAQHRIDPEQWVEMRKMARPKGPPPSLEEDVAALAGPEARVAGPRLIDRGPEALPALHAALLAPRADPNHAHRILQVLAPLEDASSVPVVLGLLGRDEASPLRRDALLVLAMLPATDEAAAFVGALAGDAREPWHTQRMAFTWYGFHRDERGRPFAEALRADPDPQKRAAALYLLARLGDESAREPAARMLAEGAPGSVRDVLFLALAELATPAEMETLVPTRVRGGGYEDALRYARYRTAGDEERPALCEAMLRAEMPGHRGLAVRCLLDAGRPEVLRPHAALDLEAPGRAALLRNEIRKAGWRVVDTEDEFRIEPAAPAAQGR